LRIEHVGRAVIALSIFMLKKRWKACYMCCNLWFDANIDIRFIWMEMKKIIGSHFCNAAEAKEALNMLSNGVISHYPSQIIDFHNIPNGLDALYFGESKGKLAIAVE